MYVLYISYSDKIANYSHRVGVHVNVKKYDSLVSMVTLSLSRIIIFTHNHV